MTLVGGVTSGITENGPRQHEEYSNTPQEQPIGCKHQQSGCKLECPRCLKFYPCKQCHDENEPDHEIERFKVVRLEC
jgi:uncharacterized CHY-type Zn-finger protein